MDLGVTHRSAVDRWECDQMEHMNVRFYGARFSSAEAYAFAVLGIPHQPSLDDRISFAHELRCGATVRIDTVGPAKQQLSYRLFEGDSDAPSATLEASYASHVHADFDSAFRGGDWTLCGRSVVRATDCDAHGLAREAILGLVNHAGIHLGIDRHKPRSDDGRLLTGSAVVACRIVRRQPAGPGALISVESRWGGCGRTSLRLLHRIVDTRGAACVALVEITLVFFDMATRRPEPLPASLRLAAAPCASTPTFLETDR